MFQSCANQAARKSWLGRGRVTDEFRPRHALLMTHIWLVHHRLSAAAAAGEGDAKPMQEAVFDKLWDDTTVRIRSMGINELMVNKSLGDVQKYSFPMLVSYDQALALPSLEEQDDHLGAAVWRNIYLAEKSLTVEHCMVLVQYMREQKKILEDTKTQAVCEGRIAWGPVPSWKGIKSLVHGEALDIDNEDKEEDSEDEDEEGEWREALAQTGKKYYWNAKTRETRWEKPEEKLKAKG